MQIISARQDCFCNWSVQDPHKILEEDFFNREIISSGEVIEIILILKFHVKSIFFICLEQGLHIWSLLIKINVANPKTSIWRTLLMSLKHCCFLLDLNNCICYTTIASQWNGYFFHLCTAGVIVILMILHRYIFYIQARNTMFALES